MRSADTCIFCDPYMGKRPMNAMDVCYISKLKTDLGTAAVVLEPIEQYVESRTQTKSMRTST